MAVEGIVFALFYLLGTAQGRGICDNDYPKAGYPTGAVLIPDIVHENIESYEECVNLCSVNFACVGMLYQPSSSQLLIPKQGNMNEDVTLKPKSCHFMAAYETTAEILYTYAQLQWCQFTVTDNACEPNYCKSNQECTADGSCKCTGFFTGAVCQSTKIDIPVQEYTLVHTDSSVFSTLIYSFKSANSDKWRDCGWQCSAESGCAGFVYTQWNGCQFIKEWPKTSEIIAAPGMMLYQRTK